MAAFCAKNAVNNTGVHCPKRQYFGLCLGRNHHDIAGLKKIRPSAMLSLSLVVFINACSGKIKRWQNVTTAVLGSSSQANHLSI